jgi:hypothetical protein
MKRSSRYACFAFAVVCMAAACVFLVPILKRGMPMYVLSEEFQAPIYLESLMHKQGEGTNISITSTDCRRLAELIRELDHRSVQRTFSTVILSLLCIVSGICLFNLARGRTAQQGTAPLPPAPQTGPSEGAR